MFGDRLVGNPNSSQRKAPLRRGLRAALLIFAVLCACGKQGEGERCDVNNGRLDCEAGLLCRILDSGFSLCCPEDLSQPAVDACLSGNAELPPDPAAPDAASEPVVESPADGGGDSGT